MAELPDKGVQIMILVSGYSFRWKKFENLKSQVVKLLAQWRLQFSFCDIVNISVTVQ